MKAKYIICSLILLVCNFLFLNAQLDPVAIPKDEIVSEAPCITISSEVECNFDGTVTVTFNVHYWGFPVADFIKIEDDKGIVVAEAGLSLSSGDVYGPVSVTFEEGEYEEYCFKVTLYTARGRICCHYVYCIPIQECPCAKVDITSLECVGENTWELCFEITNGSDNVMTEFTMVPMDPASGVCINGNPATYPIDIPGGLGLGESTEICVIITDCGAGIEGGDSFTFRYVFEDGTGWCCHLEPQTIVFPECCTICDEINEDFSGGVGEICHPYVADCDIWLCFTFDTRYQPDHLDVFIDGSHEVESGLYSSNYTTAELLATYPACVGGIGGGGNDFTAQVFVEAGQLIEICITGDDCSGPGTIWDLHVECSDEPCMNNGPHEPYEPTELDAIAFSHMASGGTDQSLEAFLKGWGNQMRTTSEDLIPNISMYPNPATKFVNIDFSSEHNYQDIMVLDMSGKAISTVNIQDQYNVRLDVSSYPVGIYFIRMMDDKGHITAKRFIKQ